MPTHHAIVQTAGTAVAVVGKSANGTPVFQVAQQYGYTVFNNVVVSTANGSALVSMASFTTIAPMG